MLDLTTFVESLTLHYGARELLEGRSATQRVYSNPWADAGGGQYIYVYSKASGRPRPVHVGPSGRRGFAMSDTMIERVASRVLAAPASGAVTAAIPPASPVARVATGEGRAAGRTSRHLP